VTDRRKASPTIQYGVRSSWFITICPALLRIEADRLQMPGFGQAQRVKVRSIPAGTCSNSRPPASGGVSRRMRRCVIIGIAKKPPFPLCGRVAGVRAFFLFSFSRG